MRSKSQGETMKNELTRKEFDVLTEIYYLHENYTQRKIQMNTGLSLGIVNKTIASLKQRKILVNGKISQFGFKLLEPYRVKRAIFLAAGFGSRLVPITLNTPKPLVRVNGRRIIDGLIDACLEAGIEEIYVVRGYLAENFDQLLYKYPMIKFLENNFYNETNNISSAICAKDFLSNAYIIESDLVINNPSLIKTYHYCSNYLGYKVDRSDDWCFLTKNRIIISQQIGGLDCYQEFGISYWNSEDGQRLSKQLVDAFNSPGGKELFWDQVPFKLHPAEYKVEVRECKSSDLVEIDTFNELKQIDKSYNV